VTESTYDKNSDKPVPAKPGVCEGCDQTKPIVMVSSWGNYCRECSDNLYETWQRKNKPDWESRAKGFDEPFELNGDGTKETE
jgi:hypothetical protein